ncbi:MAG: hypothetical protein EA365_09590 [Gloeocapsa sp. DLM2.Bin57]|nr:MAG: hypothetical protein EA365_09590 [Gloeocapsa sp. DLM2.Bin57]
MNKKFIASCLIAGLVFSLIPQDAEAQRFRRGKRYNRGSESPIFQYELLSVDSEREDGRYLFENAITDVQYNDTSFPSRDSLGRNFLFNIPQADLLSSLNEDIVTYSFRVNAEFSGNIFTEGTSEETRFNPSEFYSFSVDISGIPFDQRLRYLNDINFIIDNNILVDSVISEPRESLIVTTTDELIDLSFNLAPASNPELGGFGCSETRGEFIPVDGLDIGLCVANVLREVDDEVIPETNVLASLGGLIMLKILKRKEKS